MRVFKSTILLFTLFFAFQTISAQPNPHQDDGLDLFKQYVNSVVERVKKAEDPADKREMLDSSFDDMIAAFDKAQNFGTVSAEDKEAVEVLKANIQEKKNELNGEEGYRRVTDNRLNNFADYVQQDLEQADTVVISISATLLAAILVLLLLL